MRNIVKAIVAAFFLATTPVLAASAATPVKSDAGTVTTITGFATTATADKKMDKKKAVHKKKKRVKKTAHKRKHMKKKMVNKRKHAKKKMAHKRKYMKKKMANKRKHIRKMKNKKKKTAELHRITVPAVAATFAPIQLPMAA